MTFLPSYPNIPSGLNGTAPVAITIDPTVSFVSSPSHAFKADFIVSDNPAHASKFGLKENADIRKSSLPLPPCRQGCPQQARSMVRSCSDGAEAPRVRLPFPPVTLRLPYPPAPKRHPAPRRRRPAPWLFLPARTRCLPAGSSNAALATAMRIRSIAFTWAASRSCMCTQEHWSRILAISNRY